MPRYHGSSAKKRKALAQKQNSVRTNSPVDREQRTDEGEPKGGGNPFPPTQPAATAASPQPPVDLSLKDPSQPIAKLPDPHDDTKKETASTSQDASLTTPNHDTQLQSEERGQLAPEVTFHLPRAFSVSISRRQRSRTAKAGGRTSRALSQDEQRMFLWEEGQHQRIFDSSRFGADPIARIGFTLASGQRVKPGESLAPDLVDSHLTQLREDLTHAQRETILRPSKPASKKAKETVSSGRRGKTRRRDLQMYDSESSDDEHSVSLLSSASDRLSEASSKHSGLYATMNPDGSDTPWSPP